MPLLCTVCHGLQQIVSATCWTLPPIPSCLPKLTLTAWCTSGIDPRGESSEGCSKPDATAVTAPGVVGTLENIDQLQAAIDGCDHSVVIKFWRDGCPACKSTVEKYEAAAQKYLSSSFYLVNYNSARAFCRQAKLKVVPAAHIYTDGSLVAALPLGPSAWDAFASRLDEVHL